MKYIKEEDNFSPPAKKIRKAQWSLLFLTTVFSLLYTRGGLGPLLYTSLASSMAKTVRLSDEWAKFVNNVSQLPAPTATPHPPTGQTYTPATDRTAGSRYDVSAKSCDLGASGRCPVTATSIKGQFVSNVSYNIELYGVLSPGSAKQFNIFWSTPACSTGEPPPRITLPGLTKLVKFFWSTPACSTGEPPPRFTLPTAISSTDMG